MNAQVLIAIGIILHFLPRAAVCVFIHKSPAKKQIGIQNWLERCERATIKHLSSHAEFITNYVGQAQFIELPPQL
jgi:hypothetical protein